METKAKKNVPAIMIVCSFVAFIALYLLVTVRFITPLYFHGLIFLIPTVTFLIITILSKKNILKHSTSKITICVLTIVYTLMTIPILFIFSLQEATTFVTDISRYERVLSFNQRDMSHFPDKIPENSKNQKLFYCPPFLQGGEIIYLKYEYADDASVYKQKYEQSAEWGGDYSDFDNENLWVFDGPFKFAECESQKKDFSLYIIKSNLENWTHTRIYGVAINEKASIILFFTIIN
jgi:hypothetical protein